MIFGITYTDQNMTQSAALCRQSMLNNGVDEVSLYNEKDISYEFKRLNRNIFDSKRGAECYWIFKPYFCSQAIDQCQDGDLLIYSDAGVEWIAPVRKIIEVMDEDVFLFTNGFTHIEWCKADVLEAINSEMFYDGWAEGGSTLNYGDQNIPYYRFKQVQASVIFFKVNQQTRNFIKEWLLYCQMPGFIDDGPSKLPNFPTFAEHRHDQAILTCLQIKYGYKVHFWPTNYSEHIRNTARPEDKYPTMFNHHRKRDTGKGGGQPEW